MKTLAIVFFLLLVICSIAQENSQNKYKILSENLLRASDNEKAELYCKLSNLFLDSTGNKSLIFAEKSLKYAVFTNNKEDIVRANLQLASVFMNQSDWNKALEYLCSAEKLIDIVKDPTIQHSIYNQLGVVYKFTGQFDLSLEYYIKGLNIARKSKNNRDILFALNNIGTIYILQKKYEEALQIFISAEIECAITNNAGNEMSVIYNNIGYIYFVQGNYESARNAWNKSINSLDKKNDFKRYAVLLNNLAELEIKTGNYEQAEEHIKAADSIHQNHNFNESQKNLYYTSYQLYYDIGKYQEAINYLNKYIALKDTIYSQELNKNVSQLKADNKFIKLKNETIIKDNEIKRKNLLSKILFVVIISIIVFTILLISILAKVKKLNVKLNSLNYILKVKNDEIESNLQYAKRIQTAITHSNETYSNLVIFDKPKFGVGGDFYMHRQIENQSFFVLGDCTGHGTSGAILSVFSISAINKKMSISISPDEIVNDLNYNFLNYITASKHLKNESLTISIICVQNNKVLYAGSRQKVWHFSKTHETLNEYKTDSFLIGQQNVTNFNLKSFEAQTGDIIFMSSDGFADQFGANEKGKFKYERFRQMLINWTKEGIHETTYIENELKLWQGNAEQTDDIMVMAIKI